MPTPVQTLRSYLLGAFSGSPDGAPDWVVAFQEGDDDGFFGEGSAVWAVHGAPPVLIAGIRALLMQTLHPGAMAGVHDWSRFREDPLGRLAGTVRWVMTTTFSDRHGARRGSRYVAHLHERVTGTYRDGDGNEVPYSAGDAELLRWVHLVFAESFLSCHQVWAGSIPGGADRYVEEWAIAAELMDVADPPRSERELRQQLADFRPRLLSNDRVAETLRFIRRPPLRRSVMPGYRILFAGAVASLEPEYRRMLGLRRPWWPAKTAAAVALRVLRLVLGRPSTSEKFARRRIARLAGSGGLA